MKNHINESEVSSGNASGKAGVPSIPFGRGFYQSGNSGDFGIDFTPKSEPSFKTYKSMKHSKKNIKKRKMKKFEEFINEDATATMGNTGGMGPVVAAQPSSIPGDVAGGTKGSGDIGQVLGVYGKSSPNLKKDKKKKRLKNLTSFANFDPMKESEELDNFTARWYDNYDDEDTDQPTEIDLQNSTYSKDYLRKIQMYEEDKYKDFVTYEMSGPPPKRLWAHKADFERDMTRWGYRHTTLTKNTDMLIVEYPEQDTTKTRKAKSYGIPIYSYKDAYDKKEKLYKRVIRGKKIENIEKSNEE